MLLISAATEDRWHDHWQFTGT